MSQEVRDARPSVKLTRVLNPILSCILRTPAAGLVKPLALLEFSGRRSGRRYQVLVGWHEHDGVARVFSPADWRLNFAQPAPAVVRYNGRRRTVRGTLVRDAQAVAEALDAVISRGVSPRMLGLDMAPGHHITAADAVATRRAMIEFHDEAQ